MSGHTPGPWAYVDGAIYAAENAAVHHGKTCAECGHDSTECGPMVVVPVDPELVDEAKNGFWDNCDAPNSADLVLMAAAPELLEVVKAALPYVRDEAAKYEDDGANEPLGTLHAMEAIIVKATGDQT